MTELHAALAYGDGALRAAFDDAKLPAILPEALASNP